jgi:alpha-ketoglutarate-dependent taurine dioxygenase
VRWALLEENAPFAAVAVARHRRQILNNKANRHLHSDRSVKPVPARASMLSARMIPSQGGDTEFTNMRAAYAELPEDLRQAVKGRRVAQNSMCDVLMAVHQSMLVR